MTIYGSADVGVPLSCYIVDYLGKHPPEYLENVVNYARGVVEQIPLAAWTQNHLSLVGSLFVLESVVVSSLAYFNKKPYPRLSSSLFFNPFVLGGIGNKVKNYVYGLAKKDKSLEIEPLEDNTNFIN